MLKPCSLILLIFLACDLFCQQIPNVCGVWCSSAKDCKVQLYRNGNTIEGKIIWLLHDRDKEGRPLLDHRNPNPELRSRPMIGLKILWSAVYNPVTKYFEDGIAYMKGHEFCGRFKLNEDGTLSVTGYICSLRFLRKSDIWTRER
jgi:hypothetical protein